MSFKDMLQQEMNKLATSGGGDFPKVEYPSSKLKNDQLYFSKDNTEFLVRILPPAQQDEFFAVGFQEMYINLTNAGGTDLSGMYSFPLQLDPENNNFDANVVNWIEEGRLPNTYGRKPSKRFYLNVVQLQPLGNGQYNHEVDANGQIVVRVLKLGQQAYENVLNDIADDNITEPQGATDGFGIISAQNAYPFKIYKTGQKLETKYHTRVYEHNLGALPQGWEDELEDLNALATPSEVYNTEFTEYLCAVHNGQEEEYNASRNVGNAQGATTNQAPAAGGTQGNFGGFNPPNQTTNVTEDDMSHLPPKNAAAPTQGGFNQAPPAQTQPQGNFSQPNPAPQQQAEQPQAPQGNFGNFNQPAQGAQEQTQTQTQPQPEPTQPAPEAPQQQAQEQTQEQTPPPATGGVPNVNDLLAQVQQEANKGN